ncbi:MAG: hypothetical protein ACLP5V_02030 [Candidatus Bathyarchaeia archaeon]
MPRRKSSKIGSSVVGKLRKVKLNEVELGTGGFNVKLGSRNKDAIDDQLKSKLQTLYQSLGTNPVAATHFFENEIVDQALKFKLATEDSKLVNNLELIGAEIKRLRTLPRTADEEMMLLEDGYAATRQYGGTEMAIFDLRIKQNQGIQDKIADSKERIEKLVSK